MNDADFDVMKPPEPVGFAVSASSLEKSCRAAQR